MYKVLIDYLNHSGRMRIPGELIDMSEADAAPLIKIGAIEAIAVKSDESPTGSGDKDNKDKDPETGNTDDADPVQNDAQNDMQQQPDVSASTNNDAGSDASKTGKKESKTKAK